MSEQTGDNHDVLLDPELEAALLPGGLLYAIAANVVHGPMDPHDTAMPDDSLTVTEVGDIILPPRKSGTPKRPRWELVHDARDEIKDAASRQSDDILLLAELLRMRYPETLGDDELSDIHSERAIWLVESGANRTSIVRRQLAIDAMRRIYGPDADLSQWRMYQFGADRAIPRERNGKPNPEYAVAQAIAGDFLPADDSLTEFGLNVASALQAGYHEVFTVDEEAHSHQAVVLAKLPEQDADDRPVAATSVPELVIIRPKLADGGLIDGFNALTDHVKLQGRQMVIATNGQYRLKDELQAVRWFRANPEYDLLPTIAIGDEAGYTVQHAGSAIVTAERNPVVYMNEMVIVSRI